MKRFVFVRAESSLAVLIAGEQPYQLLRCRKTLSLRSWAIPKLCCKIRHFRTCTFFFLAHEKQNAWTVKMIQAQCGFRFTGAELEFGANRDLICCLPRH